MPKVIVDRVSHFWSKVDRGAPDACWPWLAGRARGYGQHAVTHDLRVYAHRHAYELEVGPIPAGLTIDHLCRNRLCCNPAHMEPVTASVNTKRMFRAVYSFREEACRMGHLWSENPPYMTPAGYRSCRVCRREADARYRTRRLAKT